MDLARLQKVETVIEHVVGHRQCAPGDALEQLREATFRVEPQTSSRDFIRAALEYCIMYVMW